MDTPRSERLPRNGAERGTLEHRLGGDELVFWTRFRFSGEELDGPSVSGQADSARSHSKKGISSGPRRPCTTRGPVSGANAWSTSLIWGRNHKTSTKRSLDSYLIETLYPLGGKNFLTGRARSVDKDELLPDSHGAFRIGAYTAGYTRDAAHSGIFRREWARTSQLIQRRRRSSLITGNMPRGINVYVQVSIEAGGVMRTMKLVQLPVHRVVQDPVCGMSVDPAHAAASVDYQGKAYYFCHPGCLNEFQTNPAQYLSPEPKTAAPAPQSKQVESPVANCIRRSSARSRRLSDLRHGSRASRSCRGDEANPELPT